ncbi:MAG: hypothetical protein ACC658_16885 [Acidimicrobiia bacterium]
MSLSLLGKVAVFGFVFAACAPVTPVATEPCVSPEAPDAGAPVDVVGDLAGLGTELVVRGLVEPTDVIEPPGLDALLVTEKPGRIVVIRDGRVLDEPLLDIEDSVSSDFNERGLLSMRRIRISLRTVACFSSSPTTPAILKSSRGSCREHPLPQWTRIRFG